MTAAASAGNAANPLVGVVMGSHSDWETMRHAVETLDALGIPRETRVVSAHRTPDLLFEYAAQARARGIEVIIAGAKRDKEETIYEISDLAYHVMVLMIELGISVDRRNDDDE